MPLTNSRRVTQTARRSERTPPAHFPHSVTRLFDRPSHNPSFRSISSGRPEGEVLDFCVPVNSHFPPPALMHRVAENLDQILRYYPDYADVHQAHIAALAGLDPRTIVAANGATELVSVLCQEVSGPIVTCVPTFGRWTDIPIERHVPLHTIVRRRAAAFRLTVEQIIHRVREVRADTLVLSNPNNPTGAVLSLAEIVAVATELEDLHSIIVDESFIDFSSAASAAAVTSALPNLVVVKSMGKSIGWHGIRLGYAVAEPSRAARLRLQLPFWNINGVAAFVLASLSDFKAEYDASFAGVAEDRVYLSRLLASTPGLTVFPSQANFVFVELPAGVSGRALRDRLLTRHGVLVRENSNKVGSTEQYVRIAVQRAGAADVLGAALRSELGFLADSATASP